MRMRVRHTSKSHLVFNLEGLQHVCLLKHVYGRQHHFVCIQQVVVEVEPVETPGGHIGRCHRLEAAGDDTTYVYKFTSRIINPYLSLYLY